MVLTRVVVLLLLIGINLFCANPSQAEGSTDSNSADSTYVGLDVTSNQIKINGATFVPLSIRARLGLTVMPSETFPVSLESQFGFGATDATQSMAGTPVTLKVSNLLGIYLRGDLRLMQNGSLYVLLGAASAQLSGSFGNNTALPNNNTDTGYSYGAGISYKLPWKLQGYLEYMNFVDGDRFSLSGVGLGVTHRIE